MDFWQSELFIYSNFISRIFIFICLELFMKRNILKTRNQKEYLI